MPEVVHSIASTNSSIQPDSDAVGNRTVIDLAKIPFFQTNREKLRNFLSLDGAAALHVGCTSKSPDPDGQGSIESAAQPGFQKFRDGEARAVNGGVVIFCLKRLVRGVLFAHKRNGFLFTRHRGGPPSRWITALWKVKRYDIPKAGAS